MIILQMLSYPFMQRALIAGVLVSLCCALLGVPLVLKRYSMIGDGLSHVSFGSLAIAVAENLHTILNFCVLRKRTAVQMRRHIAGLVNGHGGEYCRGCYILTDHFNPRICRTEIRGYRIENLI